MTQEFRVLVQHQVVVNTSGCLRFVLADTAFEVLRIAVNEFQVLVLLFSRCKVYVAHIALECGCWYLPPRSRRIQFCLNASLRQTRSHRVVLRIIEVYWRVYDAHFFEIVERLLLKDLASTIEFGELLSTFDFNFCFWNLEFFFVCTDMRS